MPSMRREGLFGARLAAEIGRCRILYWGGVHTEAGLIVRQMRDQGLQTVLMAGDGIATDEYPEIGGPGVEGTLMTFFPNATNRPEAKAEVARFNEKHISPDGYTLYAYASVEILKQAMEAAKSLDPRKVADKMHSGFVFTTAVGDISFDRKGDIVQPGFVVNVWKKVGARIKPVEIN